MKTHLMSLVMPILPKNDLSHWVGRLVHKRWPGALGRKSVELFARYYRINLDEAELPIERYKSIGELFTRKLKPGVRPIGEGIVHPADSVITECGRIDKMKLIQAKGKDYTLPEFLKSESWAAALDGGTFLTYYLCPTDYHRVHSPIDGRVVWMSHVPGELWPVNDWSVNAIPNLFSVNERVIVGIETPHGRAVLVLVAATNVGNMTLSFDPTVATNRRDIDYKVNERIYDTPIEIRRGDEVGIFHMGSTVVMLYEPGLVPVSVCETVRKKPVKMGQSLVKILS